MRIVTKDRDGVETFYSPRSFNRVEAELLFWELHRQADEYKIDRVYNIEADDYDLNSE